MTARSATPEGAAAEWLILLREAPDDEALKSGFDEWLTADPRHADAWTGMTETARIIAAAPHARIGEMPPLPPARATWADRRTGGTGGRPRNRATALAAGLAAAAACALALPPLALHFQADHLSGAGQIERVRLGDGSTVTLGPDSAIAVDFDPDVRDVRLLSGQALFEVSPDRERPFVVSAPGLRTTVLGTGFDVRRIGGTTGVTVVHGRVRVEQTDGSGSPRELGAGDWVRLSQREPLAAGKQAPALGGAWTTGRVPVRNRAIADAIDEIRPWYRGRIVLADTALGRKRVTGTYDMRDPGRSLGLMVAPYGGQVMQITPWLMIVTAD